MKTKKCIAFVLMLMLCMMLSVCAYAQKTELIVFAAASTAILLIDIVPEPSKVSVEPTN